MKLRLCSGPSANAVNVVTLDCDPNARADILARIPPLPGEVTSRKWDEIEMIHAIEHFRPQDAREILEGVRQCLAPGGLLVLEQPNLRFCIEVVLGLRARPREQFTEQCGLAGIFGDPSHGRDEMQHRWGYTPESLAALLSQCGYSRIEILQARYHRADRDFRVEARA